VHEKNQSGRITQPWVFRPLWFVLHLYHRLQQVVVPEKTANASDHTNPNLLQKFTLKQHEPIVPARRNLASS